MGELLRFAFKRFFCKRSMRPTFDRSDIIIDFETKIDQRLLFPTSLVTTISDDIRVPPDVVHELVTVVKPPTMKIFHEFFFAKTYLV